MGEKTLGAQAFFDRIARHQGSFNVLSHKPFVASLLVAFGKLSEECDVRLERRIGRSGKPKLLLTVAEKENPKNKAVLMTILRNDAVHAWDAEKYTVEGARENVPDGLVKQFLASTRMLPRTVTSSYNRSSPAADKREFEMNWFKAHQRAKLGGKAASPKNSSVPGGPGGMRRTRW